VTHTRKSICRICTAYCPIEVEIEEGRPIRVTGDRSYPLYGGYTCVKGRSLPAATLSPSRLLASMKRQPDGSHRPIGTDQAIGEIAAKLATIVAEHGPRSVALFIGQPVGLYPASAPMAMAFMKAVGSPMVFSAATIDQPGMHVAAALHGDWGGGRVASMNADAFLIVGGNPVISKQYLSQNPARKLKDGVNGGAKLIVIDPRATETSRKAHVHLQIKPGEDAAVLAGLLHVILREQRLDHGFVSQNVQGLANLEAAVRPFSPEYVAKRAGVECEAIVAAATILMEARRAYVGGGTGIGMSGHGNLCYYLLLCIQSIRGFWPQAGETYANPSTLRPRSDPKAQPAAPRPTNFGEPMRIRGLRESVAGMPSSALMDEILTPGPGQVRALICLSNPAMSMPDSQRTAQALSSLDMLITPNVEMSATARLSHYVIATKHILETPASTHFIEGAKLAHYGLGWEEPHAQYAPALLDAPAGADLIEDALIFYRLGRRMNLKLALPQAGSELASGEAGGADGYLNMDKEPTTDELFDILCRGSVVPLAVVRAHDGPKIYAEARLTVGPREPDCQERLDVGNSIMLEELAGLRAAAATAEDGAYPFRLTVRRADDVVNSILRSIPGYNKLTYNPAYMHPDDLDALGIEPGCRVEIHSRHGSVTAIADSDKHLRRGVLSISHNFGAPPGEERDPEVFGTNVNRLLCLHEEFDRITGMPKMSAVPVRVVPVARSAHA
jgi:anaerobic selenocysteine-containing dehydrogenase